MNSTVQLGLRFTRTYG